MIAIGHILKCSSVTDKRTKLLLPTKFGVARRVAQAHLGELTIMASYDPDDKRIVDFKKEWEVDMQYSGKIFDECLDKLRQFVWVTNESCELY